MGSKESLNAQTAELQEAKAEIISDVNDSAEVFKTELMKRILDADLWVMTHMAFPSWLTAKGQVHRAEAKRHYEENLYGHWLKKIFEEISAFSSYPARINESFSQIPRFKVSRWQKAVGETSREGEVSIKSSILMQTTPLNVIGELGIFGRSQVESLVTHENIHQLQFKSGANERGEWLQHSADNMGYGDQHYSPLLQFKKAAFALAASLAVTNPVAAAVILATMKIEKLNIKRKIKELRDGPCSSMVLAIAEYHPLLEVHAYANGEFFYDHDFESVQEKVWEKSQRGAIDYIRKQITRLYILGVSNQEIMAMMFSTDENDYPVAISRLGTKADTLMAERGISEEYMDAMLRNHFAKITFETARIRQATQSVFLRCSKNSQLKLRKGVQPNYRTVGWPDQK